MKNLKYAFLISLTLTVLLYLYFLISGQSLQGTESLAYAGSLFAGVWIYLWFAGRRSK